MAKCTGTGGTAPEHASIALHIPGPNQQNVQFVDWCKHHQGSAWSSLGNSDLVGVGAEGCRCRLVYQSQSGPLPSNVSLANAT